MQHHYAGAAGLGVIVRASSIARAEPASVRPPQADWLEQVFNDLDSTSDTLQIQISPDHPYFRLTTDGEAGTTQIECPKDADVVESFTCRQVQIHWCVVCACVPHAQASCLWGGSLPPGL